MADTGAGEKLKVFISYSRRDSAAFADELEAGLALSGFAPSLDRHDIAAGEDWEARLGSLITQSDTVVFVVSPEAVKSDRCAWEVDRTIELSKRLLPVIFKPVPDHDIPEKLRRLQFVRFDTRPGFARPLSQLAEALRDNLGWIREHTRLGELARRWDGRERSGSLPLRGGDLDAAKAWMAARKPGAPEITETQRAFISASEEGETTRLGKERAQLEAIRSAQEATAQKQRRIAWLLAGLALLVGGSILGIIAWINQSFIKEQLNWYWNVRPYRRANFDNYVLPAARERALKPGEPFRECAKDCPEMIVVPAGEFKMGSPVNEKGRFINEGPQHSVKIARPFAVSVYDVTLADWHACASFGGCLPKGRGGDAHPIVPVSWEGAQAYRKWLRAMTGKEDAMRFAHDPAKGLHFGKALALPGRSRIHLVLGVGFAGRDRGLSQQRRPQGDRAAHARTERGEGGGQALRARAIGPKRGRHAPGRSVIEILHSPTFFRSVRLAAHNCLNFSSQ